MDIKETTLGQIAISTDSAVFKCFGNTESNSGVFLVILQYHVLHLLHFKVMDYLNDYECSYLVFFIT